MNICGAVCIFHNVTNSRIFSWIRFVPSERNLGTWVKANHLCEFSKSCSAGPKLIASKFSFRLVWYLWSCLHFHNVTNSQIFSWIRFVPSEHNLGTWVKANYLWELSKSCSAGSKLIVTKISFRLVEYLWSCLHFS